MSLFEAKYKASRLFREKLAATGQAQLLHSVTDAHWGIGINSTDVRHPIQSFNGMNNMCKLVMQFRDIVMSRSNTQTVSVDQCSSTAETIQVPSTKVAHIIGNSLIKGIEEIKLYHGITSHRLFAPTMDKAMELIPDESDIVVYQPGTNDAKDSDFEKLISDMQTLVEAYQGRPQSYSDRGDYQGRPQPTMTGETTADQIVFKIVFAGEMIVLPPCCIRE